MKLAENKEEMISLGRQIARENPMRYPPELAEELLEKYRDVIPDEKWLWDMLYAAIYCQKVYGSSILEYATYDFENRTHEERTDYLTWYNRFPYMTFLNRASDIHLLDNKYEAYCLLKPFYKRDAMLLSGEGDYSAFCAFAAKHKRIFVKPVNLGLAEGVHRLVLDDTSDLQKRFCGLLQEAAEISSTEVTRHIEHSLILEEEIIPSAAISQFNPNDMSILRVTTIRVKDKTHFFYPCFRMMYGNGKKQSGEVYSMDALIDANTGTVITDGINSFVRLETHPVSGMKIKGFVMPQWDELKQMLTRAAAMFPTIRYIGWDVAHTEQGWCIIEGNTSGEFFAQMCVGHGLKRELENLIGFRVPFGFDWGSLRTKGENTICG